MVCSLERDGDLAARSLVLESLRPRIEKMSAYFGRQFRIDEDDLRQEAWVAVLEMLPRLDPSIGSADQHLLKRARWRILDVIRRQRRRQHLPLEEVESRLTTCIPAAGGPDLAILLSRLTLVQRRIVRGLLEGYTWREVGAQLGCTSANVAYHVRRIRQVYLQLEDQGREPGS